MLNQALAVAGLELRQILYGKKVLVIVLLTACAVALGYVVRRFAPAPDSSGGWPVIYIFMAVFLFLHTLVLLIPLLLTTSLLREETDEGTLVYLFTRPVPKPVVLLSKFAVATAVALAIVATGMLFFHLGFTGPGKAGGRAYDWGGRLWSFLLAGGLGVVGYGAIFTFVGLVSKRALIWGIAYGFLSEFILAIVPAVVKEVTLMHYVRSVALSGETTFGDRELDRVLGVADLVSVPGATAVVLCTAAVFLLLSVVLVSVREYFETRTAEAT